MARPVLRGVTAGVLLAVAQGTLSLLALGPDVGSTGRLWAPCTITRAEQLSPTAWRVTLTLLPDQQPLAALAPCLPPGSAVAVALDTTRPSLQDDHTHPRNAGTVRLYTPVHVDNRSLDVLVRRRASDPVAIALTDLTAPDSGGARLLGLTWPVGRFVYTANEATHLMVVVAGLGVAVVARVLAAVLADPADHAHVVLVQQAASRASLFLHAEMQALLDAHRHRFSAVFVVRRMPSGPRSTPTRLTSSARYLSGELTEDALSAGLALAPGADSSTAPRRLLVWMAGPRRFLDHATDCLDALTLDGAVERRRRVFTT
jgi:ferredoxin-NADP reductase